MSDKTIRCRVVQDITCPLGNFRAGAVAEFPADLATVWAKDGAVQFVKSGGPKTAEAPAADQETAEAPAPKLKRGGRRTPAK